MISTHAIRDISYCSADREDKCVFAYITKDRQANVNYSHVFMTPSKVCTLEGWSQWVWLASIQTCSHSGVEYYYRKLPKKFD